MELDENAIRRRAFRTWEADGRPAGQFEDYYHRARQEIEAEFLRATAHVGDVEHRLNPPVQVEEALELPVPGERRT